jgi:hypothetical protein
MEKNRRWGSGKPSLNITDSLSFDRHFNEEDLDRQVLTSWRSDELKD